ncbi:SDR family NAD(P)-dependent oxidoreductase [Fluviicola taffensis]|uniref:3-oxoacyl-(Acyl-carrier-protein) reductase n=1 Tax=Fluviicola taffensis (strain DSM 16823 / NCIMB 13979 / RW262) TaxID=755732 RepID=F2IHP0_FLUTR|nr:SDR family NAD(P)-dependent oxidoreductase [Fluviicola taffensis]AEA44818.1 3-oxoacyl-(acyl-carrier-protein) reductase [Fluviicola taffensis DSM 16823]
MDKKVILITGATGGLGSAMVKYFEKQDVKLALHTFQQDPFDVRCEHAWFKADLRDQNQVKNLIASILANFGRVDVLINNAGISKNGMSWKLSSADFNEVISVNLTAPFLLSQGFIPSMREHNFGRIINISSVVAQTGVPGTVAYAASKAGILGMTKTIAKELASFSITCNALALGYFDQGMITEVSPEMQEQIINQIPKRKLGGVETILNTIDWLLKDESDYVTGQTISLNGGLYT